MPWNVCSRKTSWKLSSFPNTNLLTWRKESIAKFNNVVTEMYGLCSFSRQLKTDYACTWSGRQCITPNMAFDKCSLLQLTVSLILCFGSSSSQGNACDHLPHIYFSFYIIIFMYNVRIGKILKSVLKDQWKYIECSFVWRIERNVVVQRQWDNNSFFRDNPQL